jgi:DNA-directed RNA polymerase subunit RPC12/RpoP
MPYRCSCGAEFASAEEFVKHKASHQKQRQAPRGVVCLACGAAIPTPDDFSGMVSCLSCHKSMKVVVEKGEVQVARLG